MAKFSKTFRHIIATTKSPTESGPSTGWVVMEVRKIFPTQAEVLEFNGQWVHLWENVWTDDPRGATGREFVLPRNGALKGVKRKENVWFEMDNQIVKLLDPLGKDILKRSYQ